jgi:hypothetical protein
MPVDIEIPFPWLAGSGFSAESRGTGDALRAIKWTSMKFVVSIYRDEDGAYVAECPSIPGYVSQGKQRPRLK